MAYGLALAIIVVLLIAVQLGWWSWRRLVARETQQRERRTFESWRETPPDEDGAAEGNHTG
jgi:membrane-anchored protein YejM (alkaline phosphatase superfamily)